jgi:hypothetical protein
MRGLFVVALLTVAGPMTVVGPSFSLGDPVTDPALASRIHQLIDVAFSDEEPDSNAAEVRKIFTERGIPTTAMVGTEAAEEYLVLSTHAQALEFTKRVLDALERTPGTVPPNAVQFLRARLKQKQIESGLREPYPNAALAARLNTLFTADQAVRTGEHFDPAKMRETDARTGEEIRAIFKEFGVPTQSAVGAEAARQFVVIVQHQSADLRRAVLPQLRDNVDRGEADPAEYAMMFDRAQVDDGKPQRYGANFECQPDGTMAPSPIEDLTHLDPRRAEIGLLPMRLYAKLLLQMMPKDFCQKVTTPPPMQ